MFLAPNWKWQHLQLPRVHDELLATIPNFLRPRPPRHSRLRLHRSTVVSTVTIIRFRSVPPSFHITLALSLKHFKYASVCTPSCPLAWSRRLQLLLIASRVPHTAGTNFERSSNLLSGFTFPLIPSFPTHRPLLVTSSFVRDFDDANLSNSNPHQSSTNHGCTTILILTVHLIPDCLNTKISALSKHLPNIPGITPVSRTVRLHMHCPEVGIHAAATQTG
ncbi:hypothetical protein B0T20DRAFT_2784 [Sordaria brevicollis]|uniref:Uncharacterized protein n=1 Tax=Sordaria brevicollis TaxID=83679 RepID=A0AAE0PM72_SORBR|nr:hypothetical protein B0T20DRAFT_2784 [Sordaria brevicollis]